MTRRLAIFICVLCSVLCMPIMAVETIIVGEIVNEVTGEAIPNVNIHFRGTKIGTTSDANGAYALRVDMTAKAQLVFSAVGYYTQRFDIEPGAMAGLQVAMKEKTAMLAEIVVAPNENPALEILRQVRAHRPDNDRTLHEETAITAQREQTLFISQIQKKHLRRALWRSLQAGMIAQEDSTYLLPLYRETQSFRLSGNNMIPANDQQTQALVLTETDYSSLIGGEGNINFYASSVSLMGHAFLSPLAPGGNLYYRYYIDDSQDSLPSLEGRAGVRLKFRTRNPFYATFNGEMIIDTTTFALRAIHAYVPVEAAVNYVNDLHLSQTLAPDGTLADERISVLLDFAVKTQQAGTVFPSLLLTTSLKNPTIAANGMDSVKTIASAWGSGREGASEEPVFEESHSMSRTDSAFAKLDSIPLVRAAKWFATIVTTGYIPTGTPVDIGHIEEILQVNQHESVHIGLPFRTNEKMSKIVSLEASVGYGFRDRMFKGLGRISVDLPTPRKNILQLEYNDHYVWSEVDDFDRLLRENSMGWGNFDFTAYAFEALHRDTFCVNTAMHQRQIQLHWFADWAPFLETHLYARAGWNYPRALNTNSLNTNSLNTNSLDSYAYQSLSAVLRFSWGERKYDGYFLRRYAYSSRYPVLYLGGEFGHWTFLQDGARSNIYVHARVMLTQHANLGMGGTLSYALQAGLVVGRVPAAMLWHADANQGYAYDPYRFTLLHGNQLLADKYVALQAEWNGMGILFNLIPGIRWLHLRELVEFKAAYGYLNRGNTELNSAYLNPLTTNLLNTNSFNPHNYYAEIGVGIGNILRVCDLYSVWGYTPQTKWAWAMRFRIHLGL